MLARDLLLTFGAVFVVVDPFPIAPLFAAMTANRPTPEVRRIAVRASVFGALLLITFALIGRALFRALHIDLAALRAAGGLLLLMTSLDMLRAKVSTCRCSSAEVKAGHQRDDIAIVPLATPMLAGPGAITTVIVYTTDKPGFVNAATLIVAIVLSFAVTGVVLRHARLVGVVLGSAGTALLQRLLGLLLAATSVQTLLTGMRQLWG